MSGRRFALYFSWSRSRENTAPLGVLENRYPTLFEFRRAIWPHYEWAIDPSKYRQDITGFLDHVVLFDFTRFIQVVEAVTGQPVRVLQREHEDTRRFVLDDGLLKEVDTLIVVSLDHFCTGQEATEDEVQAVSRFLTRERSCLVVSPHHDVGITGNEPEKRLIEHAHHGDLLVPSQQRIGGFARTLLERLGLPVENRFGLNPASDPTDPTMPGRLELYRDLDRKRVLDGVTTFNLHPHLPHLFIEEKFSREALVLGKQPVNSHFDPQVGEHPFVAEGNRSFNAFVWVPAGKKRAGDVFICDATLWSAAFGGVSSLEQLWHNLALLT